MDNNILHLNVSQHNFSAMDHGKLLDDWMRWRSEQRRDKYQNKELAADSGIPESYLSSIRHNRRKMGNVMLEKLSAAFDVTQSDYLAGPGKLSERENRADDHRDVDSNQGNEPRRNIMEGSVEVERARAKALNIVYNLSPLRLGRALAYLETLSETALEEKNIRNAS